MDEMCEGGPGKPKTYEIRHPTPNRQYATRIGLLRPKVSLVAPYYKKNPQKEPSESVTMFLSPIITKDSIHTPSRKPSLHSFAGNPSKRLSKSHQLGSFGG